MEFGETPDKRWRPLDPVDGHEEFLRFKKRFHIIRRGWLGEYLKISAEYFLKLLQNGNKRARERDENSWDFWGEDEFRRTIFDHAELWMTSKGKIFCTSLPYQDEKRTIENFRRLKEKFSYPETIKLKFMPARYRFRPNNGIVYFAIYDEEVCEFIDRKLIEDEFIIRKLNPFNEKPKIPRWQKPEN